MAAKPTEPEVRLANGQFAPGGSGNPGGRPRTKYFRKVLLDLLTDEDEPNEALRLIGEALIRAAQSAEARDKVAAAQFLRDTLDGKPISESDSGNETLVVVVQD